MKAKILITIVVLSLSLMGCNKEDVSYQEDKNTINLVAPNGEKIASSIESLNSHVSEIAELRYGENKDIKIESIFYHDVSDGFLAEIYYRTYDGYVSNVIITNSTSIDAGLDGNERTVKRVKTRSENNGDGEESYYCTSANYDKCSECTVCFTSDMKIGCRCEKGSTSSCNIVKQKS